MPQKLYKIMEYFHYATERDVLWHINAEEIFAQISWTWKNTLKDKKNLISLMQKNAPWSCLTVWDEKISLSLEASLDDMMIDFKNISVMSFL